MADKIPPRIAARAHGYAKRIIGDLGDEGLPLLDEIIPRHIAAALLAQVEADCAAVCLHCREGLYSVHSANCDAIRAAAETPHGVAPSGKSVAPDGEKP